MIIGRYRITNRGYVVFGTFGIILLLLIGFAIKEFSGSVKAKVDNQSKVVQQAGNTQSGETAGSTTNTSNGATSNAIQGLSVAEKNKLLETESEIIYFKPDLYELDSVYYAQLDKIVVMSNRFKDARIVIEGHYNGYPDFKVTEFWTSLAQNRAEMVEAYFISQGVASERISVINKGCSEPVNKDGSWQEIEKNRRVEVYFEPLKQ